MATYYEAHCTNCYRSVGIVFCPNCDTRQTDEPVDTQTLLKQVDDYLKEEVTKLRQELQEAGILIED